MLNHPKLNNAIALTFNDSEISGYYYLHQNGDLIYKDASFFSVEDLESDLIRAAWPLNPKRRANAWLLLIEAGAQGANLNRIKELAEKWGVNNEDALNFVEHSFGNFILFRDGNAWCAAFSDFVNIQESQC